MHGVDFLLFAAHCDDGELWAGGTIARAVESGKRVVLAVAHHDAPRRAEAKAGASILNCEVWFRGADDDLTAWVGRVLEAGKPEILATHPVCDCHFEHSEVGNSVMQALTISKRRAAYPLRWYWFDTYYSNAPRDFPLLIDISVHFDRKVAALQCHASQHPEQLIAMAKAMSALHGQRIRAAYAEAFYPFPLLGRWPRLRELP